MAENQRLTRERITVNGIDFVLLAIILTTAILIIRFVAKACYILKKDWRRGPSLLEIKPAPQPIPPQLPKKMNIKRSIR
jgi:hypothetical protein